MSCGSISSIDFLAWIRNTVGVWEILKHKLYDSDSGFGLPHHSEYSPGENKGKLSQNRKFGQTDKLGQNGKVYLSFKCKQLCS